MKLSLYSGARASTPRKVQPHHEDSGFNPIVNVNVSSSPVSTPGRKGKIAPDFMAGGGGIGDGDSVDMRAIKEFCTDLIKKQEKKLERQIQAIDSNLFSECQDITIRLSQVEQSIRDISRQFAVAVTNRDFDALQLSRPGTTTAPTYDLPLDTTDSSLASRVAQLENRMGNSNSSVVYVPGNNNQLNISHESPVFAWLYSLQASLKDVVDSISQNSNRIETVEATVADLMSELDSGLRQMVMSARSQPSSARGLATVTEPIAENDEDFVSLDVVFDRVSGTPHGVGTANEFSMLTPAPSREAASNPRGLMERPFTSTGVVSMFASSMGHANNNANHPDESATATNRSFDATKKQIRSRTAETPGTGRKKIKTSRKWKKIAKEARRTISDMRNKLWTIEQMGNQRIALVDRHLKQHDAKILAMESGITTVRLRNRQLASREIMTAPGGGSTIGDVFPEMAPDTIEANDETESRQTVSLTITDSEAETRLAKFEAIITDFDIFKSLSARIELLQGEISRLQAAKAATKMEPTAQSTPLVGSSHEKASPIKESTSLSRSPKLDALEPVVNPTTSDTTNSAVKSSSGASSEAKVAPAKSEMSTGSTVKSVAVTESGDRSLSKVPAVSASDKKEMSQAKSSIILDHQEEKKEEAKVLGHVNVATTSETSKDSNVIVAETTPIAFTTAATVAEVPVQPLASPQVSFEELQRQVQELQERVAVVNAERNKTKKDIKHWIDSFVKEHGAEPTIQQKEPIRELYEDYAKVKY
jgi:uncharacterized small protein (DUF1192 family)